MAIWVGIWPRGGATAVGLSMLTVAWWLFVRSDVNDDRPDDIPADPRVTFNTPFRNVRPNVSYVGDAACASCHSDIDKTYHQHPMGRSAALIGRTTMIEEYGANVNNPFRALGRLECRVEKQGTRVVHHIVGKDSNDRVLTENSIDVTIAIGSGVRGQSYLYVHEGCIWESPISWFTHKAVWDLSPGFFSEENFQRGIVGECLYCHTQHVEPISNTENHYREPIFPIQSAIGCERCHGPGELHVAERTSRNRIDGIDTSIVNPKHLTPELRDSICQQCHLQGEVRVARRGRSVFEFRPGLPLGAFLTTYIKHPNLIDYAKSVGQFEQISVSKCFLASQGEMTCTSCHDPHEGPAAANKADFYRSKCNSCHLHNECKFPEADRAIEHDSCIACHMMTSPSANIAHTSVTDHRISRFGGRSVMHRDSPLKPGELPLVPFDKKAVAADPEDDRNVGMALAEWALELAPPELVNQYQLMGLAQSRLEASLGKWPKDVPALERLAELQAAQGRAEQSLLSIRKVLDLAPEREHTLALAVKVATQAGNLSFAEDCANKIVAANPTSFRHLMRRALVRMELGKFTEAEADFRAALAENPTHCQLRVILAACLQRHGDTATARRELNTALGMARVGIEEAALRRLFVSLSRSR